MRQRRRRRKESEGTTEDTQRYKIDSWCDSKPSQANPTRADPTEPLATLGSFTPAAHSRHYLFQMSSTASFRLRCGTSTFSSPKHTARPPPGRGGGNHIRSPLRARYMPPRPLGPTNGNRGPREPVQANRETGLRLAPFSPYSLRTTLLPPTPSPYPSPSHPLLVFKVMCSPRITTHSGARLRRFTNPWFRLIVLLTLSTIFLHATAHYHPPPHLLLLLLLSLLQRRLRFFDPSLHFLFRYFCFAWKDAGTILRTPRPGPDDVPLGHPH